MNCNFLVYTGTFAVGNTVTSSIGGSRNSNCCRTADQSLYSVVQSGTWQDGLSDTLTNGSGASATVDSYTSGVNRYLSMDLEL